MLVMEEMLLATLDCDGIELLVSVLLENTDDCDSRVMVTEPVSIRAELIEVLVRT